MINSNKIKTFLSTIFGSSIAFKLTSKLIIPEKQSYIRAVYYHDTPKNDLDNLGHHLEWYSKHFQNCNYKSLRCLLDQGHWEGLPGLLISFDDGLRNNYEIAAPLLEEYGFTGWFMLPTAFIDENNISKQYTIAKKNRIVFEEEFLDRRLSMSWEDVYDLEKRGHVITCHSMNHRRLSDKLTDNDINEEISSAKALMEKKLKHPITAFTWVGGEEWSYGNKAYEAMLKEGFSEIFCTNSSVITSNTNPDFLDRSHVESYYSLNMVRFVLGGLYDLKYKNKRSRIFKRLTNK